MEFEIIKNSESFTGYDVEDKTYIGIIPHLCCAWQFEVIKDGKIGYFGNRYIEGTPEMCYEEESTYSWGEDMFDVFDAKPTGRVVFAGYYERHWEYDWEYRDEYPVYTPSYKTEEAIAKYVVC